MNSIDRNDPKITFLMEILRALVGKSQDLIGTIYLNASSLLTLVNPGIMPANAVESIFHQSEGLTKILRSLQLYAGAVPASSITLNVVDFLSEIKVRLTKLVEQRMDLSIKIGTTELGGTFQKWVGIKIPPIKADPELLEILISNVLQNSCDGEYGNVITIEVSTVKDPDPTLKGNYVKLIISDNGTGMEEDVLKNIYTPFFTTKDPTKHLGLGLSEVFGITKLLDAEMDITSSEDGTVCTFYFPAFVSQKPSGKILVIEPYNDQRKVLKDKLTDIGFDVLECTDESSAQNVLLSFQGTIPIKIVILPMTLGFTSGPIILQHLQQTHQSFSPISIFTASASTPISGGTVPPDMYILRKPFFLSDLAHIIQEILDSKNP